MASEFKNLILFLKAKSVAQGSQSASKGPKDGELRDTSRRVAALEESARPLLATAALLKEFGRFLTETSHISREKPTHGFVAGRAASLEDGWAVVRKLESVSREIQAAGGIVPAIISRRLIGSEEAEGFA